MKILSLLFAAIFIIATTSVAQVRYAFTHPSEMAFVLLNFAMAACIYLLISNSRGSYTDKFTKISNILNSKRRLPNKVYRIS